MGTYTGTSGNDTLNGSSSADTLYGGAGNDAVYGGTGNDAVFGGDGNDYAYGGDGADLISGGNNNDSISGGLGSDGVDGGAGDDVAVGGQGTDSLYGAVGNDLLLGDGQLLSAASYASSNAGLATTLSVTNSADGAIYLHYINSSGVADLSATIAPGQTYAFSTLTSSNYILKDEHGYFLEPINGAVSQTVTYGPNLGDVLYGGANDDSMLGQYGDDTLYGDDGNDSVEGGSGNDSLFGGTGSDSIKGETGNDVVYGGAGNDTVSLGSGNDTFASWASDESGNDTIDGGAGDDLVYGGIGDDSLDGGADNDRLNGGSGADRLDGGSGNDILSGGSGDDTIKGGAGKDTFTFATSDGHDYVSDFDISMGGGHTADQLDVSDLRNANGRPVRPWDITVSDDGQGQALLTFPGGESVVLGGVSPAQAAKYGMLHSMGVPCFAAGTRIMTPQGERRVEDMLVGDLVTTPSGTALPILWHGRRWVADLAAQPQKRPIRLAAGGFGNHRDLLLSPQHGVYLPQAMGLIRAYHLVGISPRARVAMGLRSISYHHLLLPRHAMLMAEGATVESFYPGAMALAALSAADRAAVGHAIFAARSVPQADSGPDPTLLASLYGPRCLPLLSRGAAQSTALARPAVWWARTPAPSGIGKQLALSVSAQFPA